jgi:capsid protein
MESINYSSARFESLESQAYYRSLQQWFINAFVKKIWENWLEMQLLTNNWGLNIPASKYNKFNNVRYTPRSWQSIDPSKDSRADQVLLANGLTSHSDVIKKLGRDPEEVFLQIAADKKRMEELDITPLDMMIKTANLAMVDPVEATTKTFAE